MSSKSHRQIFTLQKLHKISLTLAKTQKNEGNVLTSNQLRIPTNLFQEITLLPLSYVYFVTFEQITIERTGR